ncbi:hypothetical protein M0804_001970 [Polistes exclamans]|nr:hypothetical protein M0804_001970 [Polistes exclamans]
MPTGRYVSVLTNSYAFSYLPQCGYVTYPQLLLGDEKYDNVINLHKLEFTYRKLENHLTSCAVLFLLNLISGKYILRTAEDGYLTQKNISFAFLRCIGVSVDEYTVVKEISYASFSYDTCVHKYKRNRTNCGYIPMVGGSRGLTFSLRLTYDWPHLQRKPYRLLTSNRISSCGFIAFLFG